jgi:hypothetical protein
MRERWATLRGRALVAGLLIAAGALGAAFAVAHRPRLAAPLSASAEPRPAPAPQENAPMVKVGGTSNACACSQRIEP